MYWRRGGRRGRRMGMGWGAGYGMGRRYRGWIYGPGPKPWCPWFGYWGEYNSMNYQFSQTQTNYQYGSTQGNRIREILLKAIKGQRINAPYGGYNIPIIYNDSIIGWLWEDVPLDKVNLGEFLSTGRGTRVSLIYKGRIVGFVWFW